MGCSDILFRLICTMVVEWLSVYITAYQNQAARSSAVGRKDKELTEAEKTALRSMSGPSEMPYAIRKRYYAKANRMVRARDVDPAIVRKYDMLKSDSERWPGFECGLPLTCMQIYMHAWI